MACLKAMNDEFMSVSTHIEYSWGNKMELLPVPSGDETKAIEVDNSQDSIELIEQKLLNENSDYWIYIRDSELSELLQLALRHEKEDDHVNSNEEEKCILLMLNSEKVLMALKLLLAYFNQTIKLPSNVTKRPSDIQVVNWITLIIQSHMEDVLFSKDKVLQKILKQLKKALSAKMEEWEDFECIQNYFSVIEKKSILPQKRWTEKYSIESLDI